jgi:SH3-binding, glutamic acid-rich protein
MYPISPSSPQTTFDDELKLQTIQNTYNAKMADLNAPNKYDMDDPTLYLFTSLTSGSSHIITATSRLETILRANKIPFTAIDVATDENAKKLWMRRTQGKKKYPGLVKGGFVVGVSIYPALFQIGHCQYNEPLTFFQLNPPPA